MSAQTDKHLVKKTSFDGLTKVVALDCEMVGTGYNGKDSMLARVSLVNYFGHCIYDKYVKPTEKVTDFRTSVSGIRQRDLKDGADFTTVQQEVFNIIKGRILVGHGIRHDLKALYLSHPRSKMRDTSSYFKKYCDGQTPSLKRLAIQMLGVEIQSGEHDSVTDAQAVMRLYTMYKNKWEKDIKHFKNAKLKEKKIIAKKIKKK